MNLNSIRTLICLILWLLICAPAKSQNLSKSEWEVRLAMRQIGHDLLTSWNDDSTRVLPILAEKNVYRIQFEPRLKVAPIGLVATINRVAEQTHFANEYLVQVISCDSQKLEYSYYVLLDSLKNDSVIPCMKRPLPTDCYELEISILDSHTSSFIQGEKLSVNDSEATATFFERNNRLIWVIVAVILVLLFWYSQNRKKTASGSGLLNIGDIQFDPKNMQLISKGNHVELTSKESELLHLLYINANQTIERETLLNQVWGDEGGYVGRTLDVFVSKLRKKLEADPKIKLVNVRGVGYKLIINE